MQELATRFIEVSKQFSDGSLTKSEYLGYTRKVEQYLIKNEIPFVDFIKLTS